MKNPKLYTFDLGNNFQYYQDRCSLKNYARLCQMHLILADYIDFLMDENTNLGKPVQRAMLWVAEVNIHSMKMNYNGIIFKTAEEMEQVKDYKYQYMLGDDMVVAPVIRKGNFKQTLYLPAGEWISIWDDLRKGRAMTFMHESYSDESYCMNHSVLLVLTL